MHEDDPVVCTNNSVYSAGPAPTFQSFVYAASHGYRSETGAASAGHLEGSRSIIDQLRMAAAELSEKLVKTNWQEQLRIPGVEIEDNEFAVSVHYRNVDPQWIPVVEAAVDAVVSRRPTLKKCGGKKVFDPRPALEWNKGAAIQWLLKHVHANPRDPNVWR
eukprot:GHVU01174123.1.p2 GENE.GHVU01174123.1~~GHVU01174123.1.p2  ORF type:complete len:161 (+),score=25.07 GHVU01174123.1:406-888(+)